MSQPEGTPTAGENQLVVDTRDLRSIAAELTSMTIGFGDLADAPEIPALNVAMITLSDVDRVAQQADAETARERLAAEGPAIGHTDPPTDLAVLMAVLRDRFETKYHRSPRMGRNRDMESVGGLPHWAAAPANLPEVVDEAIVLRPESSVPGPGLRVGVLDTAMFANASLKGRFTCDDFVSDDLPRPAWAGHATFIVGRILQRAPGADVVVRKVLEGRFGTATAWQLAEGMASFLGTGVEVLNLSLGCFTADDEPPFLLQRATEALLAEMIVVAAAGNHGETLYPMVARDDDGKPEFRPVPLHPYSPMWPAAIPGVVAVGAATVQEQNGEFAMQRAAFTPENVPWIELWAPGVDVVSTFLEGDVRTITWEPEGGDWGRDLARTIHEWNFKSGAARWTGTSMAAGDVTGEIAAVAQAENISARDALQKIMRRPGGPTGPDDVRSWV